MAAVAQMVVGQVVWVREQVVLQAAVEAQRWEDTFLSMQAGHSLLRDLLQPQEEL